MATLFMLTALLIFGEITPKTLAKRYPEAVSMAFARPLTTLIVILTPISFLFNSLMTLVNEGKKEPTFTEEELSVVIDEIEDEGILEESESELIKSAMKFDDKMVSEILTPRVDIVAIDRTSTLEKSKESVTLIGIFKNTCV